MHEQKRLRVSSQPVPYRPRCLGTRVLSAAIKTSHSLTQIRGRVHGSGRCYSVGSRGAARDCGGPRLWSARSSAAPSEPVSLCSVPYRPSTSRSLHWRLYERSPDTLRESKPPVLAGSNLRTLPRRPNSIRQPLRNKSAPIGAEKISKYQMTAKFNVTSRRRPPTINAGRSRLNFRIRNVAAIVAERPTTAVSPASKTKLSRPAKTRRIPQSNKVRTKSNVQMRTLETEAILAAGRTCVSSTMYGPGRLPRFRPFVFAQPTARSRIP